MLLFMFSCNDENNTTSSMSDSFETTTVSITSPTPESNFEESFRIEYEVGDFEIVNNFEINIYYFIENQSTTTSVNDFTFHRCNDFKIMKYPVTNAQYANYLNSVVDLGLMEVETVVTQTSGIETKDISLPSNATGIQKIEIIAYNLAQNIVAESSTIFNDETGTGYFISGNEVKGPKGEDEFSVFYDTEAGQILFDGSNGGFNVEGGKESFPVVGITWNGATDFADYFELDIPTQDQWTFAARGSEDWMYPWNSNTYESFANYDNTHSTTTMEVESFNGTGSLRYAQSYCGLFDMSGNVWQFTSSPGLMEDTYIVTGSSGGDMKNNLKIDVVSSIWQDIATQSHGFRMVASAGFQTEEIEGCMDQSSCSYGSWVDIPNDEMCFETDCLENCNGEAFNDSCNECVGGATGLSEGYSIDCMGLCDGEAFLDNCGVCVMGTSENNIPNCISLSGVSIDSDCQSYIDNNPDYVPWTSSNYLESNANQIDCSGVCISGQAGCKASIFNTFDDCGNDNAMLDDCSLCYGGILDNQVPSESDCNGDCNGDAEIDCCGDCVGGLTGLDIDQCSEYNKDECNVCTGGDYDGCVAGDTADCGHEGDNNDKDCNGDCFGSAIENECGCVGGVTGYETDYCYGCNNQYADNFWCNKTPGIFCFGFPQQDFVQNCRDECRSGNDFYSPPDNIQEDGSCEFSGCKDSLADNFGLQNDTNCEIYDQSGECNLSGSNSNYACSQAVSGDITGTCTDNGSCQYVGCTNDESSNYDSNANVDNGLCVIGSICIKQGSESNSVDLNFSSIEFIYGFQITVSGSSIASVSSALSDQAGFIQTVSGNQVIAFSLSGSYISETEGTLISLQFEDDVEPSTLSIDELIISGDGGKNLVFTSDGGCTP